MNLRDESRKNWGTANNEHLSLEQINTGALLRLADATEKMAQRYTSLIDERDRLDSMYKAERKISRILERSNAALRGHLKRAKNTGGLK